MSQKTLKRIDLLILLYAAFLSVGAYVFFGGNAFYSVGLGAMIALANWIASRWLGVRLILAGNKTRVAIFLAVKTVLVLGVILLVLTKAAVEPIAFMVGLSVLVLGVLSKGLTEAVVEGNRILREEEQ